MEILKNLLTKYSNLQTIFKSFFLLVILFLMFFAVNLFITVKNKSQSAYSILSSEDEKSMPKLQDTRVHNWSEVDKGN